MSLSQDPVKLAASKRFIEFAHNPDINAAWLNKMAAGCYLPCTDAASRSPVFTDNEIVRTFGVAIANEIEASKNGKLFGFTSDLPVTTIGSVTGANIISEMSQKVVFGQSAASAAAEADALIRSLE
jgi:ABC-type glycerol-3-phosphate transport system substrate-binding protein